VVLRSDILERVVQDTKDLTFQREKFEDYFVKLNCSKHQLKELIQRRIGLLFKRQYHMAQDITFEDIFPHKIANIDPFYYIAERTLMRPRSDYIRECMS